MPLRGHNTKPDGSIPELYEDIREAQEAIKNASETLERTQQRLDNVKDTAVFLEPKPQTNEELMKLINRLNERIDALERDQVEASRKEKEAYAGLKHQASQLACGGLAGAIARSAVAPIDRVKILQQTQHVIHQGQQKYSGVLHTLQTIVKEEGVGRLWRGNLTNLVRVIPYSATQFASYDYYKHYIMDQQEPGKGLSFGQRCVAGAFAGMTATTVTHPLDVIRLRLSVNPDLAGPMGALKDVLKENGMRSLMKGYTPTLMSIGPFISINFASFDWLKNWYYQDQPGAKQNPFVKLGLGAAAGLFAQTCCYPLDTIRRRMQLKGTHYSSTSNCIATIIKTEGPQGFYRGMVPNALKVIPSNAIRFVAFDMLKGIFGVESKKKKKD